MGLQANEYSYPWLAEGEVLSDYTFKHTLVLELGQKEVGRVGLSGAPYRMELDRIVVISRGVSQKSSERHDRLVHLFPEPCAWGAVIGNAGLCAYTRSGKGYGRF